MENFKLVTEGIDISEFLTELEENEELFLANTSRQDKIMAQKDTRSIYLRTYDPRASGPNYHKHFTIWTEHAEQLPKIKAWLEKFCHDQMGELGTAAVVRLKPKAFVGAHIDMGDYYKIRTRYHLVLFSAEGSILNSGDETQLMQAGELWEFDNKEVHTAENPSNKWRIHLIFDMIAAENRQRAWDIMCKEYDRDRIQQRQEAILLEKSLNSPPIKLFFDEGKLGTKTDLAESEFLGAAPEFKDLFEQGTIKSYKSKNPEIKKVENCYLAGEDSIAFDEEGRIFEETTKGTKNFDKGAMERAYSFAFERITEPAAIFCRRSKYNFWLWIYEAMLSLSSILNHNPHNKQIKIFMPQDLSKWQKDFINVLNLQPKAEITYLESNILKFDQLFIPSTISINQDCDYIGEEFFTMTKTIRENLLSQQNQPGPEKVYIARYDINPHLQLENEDKLAAKLQEQGFEIIAMNHTSIVDVIRLCLDAKKIIGLSGTGMMAGAFASPDCEVTEIFNQNSFDSSNQVFSVLNRAYGNHHNTYIAESINQRAKNNVTYWQADLERLLKDILIR